MIKASKRTIIIILVIVLLLWACWGGYRLFYRYSGKSDLKSFETTPDTTIVIKAHTSDIFVSGTDSSTLTLESNKAGELNTSITDNTITISLSDRKYFADGFLTVELPRGIKSATITTNVGDLDIASTNVDSIKLSTDTGDIDIVNLNTNNADIKTSVGSVEISDSTIETDIVLKLSTGDLTVKQTNFANMTASTDVGDIEIYGGEFKSIDATSPIGDITIRLNQDVNTIELETGKVGDAYIFDEYFDSGLHTISKTPGEITIKAETSIGSIDIDK